MLNRVKSTGASVSREGGVNRQGEAILMLTLSYRDSMLALEGFEDALSLHMYRLLLMLVGKLR